MLQCVYQYGPGCGVCRRPCKLDVDLHAHRAVFVANDDALPVCECLLSGPLLRLISSSCFVCVGCYRRTDATIGYRVGATQCRLESLRFQGIVRDPSRRAYWSGSRGCSSGSLKATTFQVRQLVFATHSILTYKGTLTKLSGGFNTQAACSLTFVATLRWRLYQIWPYLRLNATSDANLSQPLRYWTPHSL